MLESEIRKRSDRSFINSENYPEMSTGIIVTHCQTKGLLKKLLLESSEIYIASAFITISGVMSIFNELDPLNVRRKKKIQILTGDYQFFTQPGALRVLINKFQINTRMLFGKEFHGKFYIFKLENSKWACLVGSTNLTGKALSRAYEFNLYLESNSSGEVMKELCYRFNNFFKEGKPLNKKNIDDYEKRYNANKIVLENIPILTSSTIRPNLMQKYALEALRNERKLGKTRALVVSATGTGKTYLSAFDVSDVNPKTCLFIVHRRLIAEKAYQSYLEIFPKRKSEFGVAWEGKIDTTSNFLFATLNTIFNNLASFKKNRFEYIIIDEAHHLDTKMYTKILNYFQPKFILGMTATPDRQQGDIYSFFNNRVTYEIKLREALKENLLVPFHYFAISSFYFQKKLRNTEDFFRLSKLDQARSLLEVSDRYPHSGIRNFCIIFVASTKDARELDKALNSVGRKSRYLIGTSDSLTRLKTIDLFEKGEIEFLIAVDLLNEGVDIPCINKVIFLRPTDSSIVYIQQLGRGLRKWDAANKEYTIVLDFVQNFNKSYLIVEALSDSRTKDKKQLTEFLFNQDLEGESTVNFDEIAKERIFQSIQIKTKSIGLSTIKEDYLILKQKLGAIPSLKDFYDNGMVSPVHIFNFMRAKRITYSRLVADFEGETIKELDDSIKLFLSSELLSPAKRKHEWWILNFLISRNSPIEAKELIQIFEKENKLKNQAENIKNSLQHLALDGIFRGLKVVDSLKKPLIKITERKVSLSYEFSNFLKDKQNLSYFTDLYVVNYQMINDLNIDPIEQKSLILHEEYSRFQAYHYANFKYNEGSKQSGYNFGGPTGEDMIIFMRLNESANYSNYDNKIISKNEILWYSKFRAKVFDKKGKLKPEGRFAHNQLRNVYIFISAKSNESSFYYVGGIGRINANDFKEIEIDKKPIIEFRLNLKNPISDTLMKQLDYGTNELK